MKKDIRKKPIQHSLPEHRIPPFSLFLLVGFFVLSLSVFPIVFPSSSFAYDTIPYPYSGAECVFQSVPTYTPTNFGAPHARQSMAPFTEFGICEEIVPSCSERYTTGGLYIFYKATAANGGVWYQNEAGCGGSICGDTMREFEALGLPRIDITTLGSTPLEVALNTACGECNQKEADWESTYCTGPGLTFVSYDCATDTGRCYDCAQNEADWEATYCTGPGLTMISYDCPTDTGVCEDCNQKEADWESAYCSGPGQTLISYDCATDTGECEEVDCAAQGAAWEATYCTGPGLTMTSYDCATDTGVCKTRNCALMGAQWEATYCTGPGLVMTSYDCATDTGTCEDVDCASQGAAWESTYCTGPGLTMTSYECATNTGTCRPMNCAVMGAQWEALYCTGPGMVMTGYDCATNTGTCEETNCASKEAAWEEMYCNGPGLTLISYNCSTNTGECYSSACYNEQIAWEDQYCSGPGLLFVSYDCASNTGVCKDATHTLDPDVEDISEFTDRFNQFIDDLRASPLFSIPDQVLGNIPSGGNPVYTVNMGSYGSADINLSEYDGIFSIVRTVLLVCFSFAALRIVASHK